MDNDNFIKKEQECAEKIKEKLSLNTLPDIITTIRELSRYYDEEGLYQFECEGKITAAPPGYYHQFSDYLEVLKDDFIGLFNEIQHHKPYKIYLIKVQISYDNIIKPAAFEWIFTGSLKTEKKFCAIFYIRVENEFRKCGLSSLLKLREINLAKSEQCNFIQTFHETYIPNFDQAIIPSLKNGFILYPGIFHKQELFYNETGFIHLRKYFNPAEIISSQVVFTDGKILKSPEQNEEIIKHFLSFKEFSSKSIKQIQKCHSETLRMTDRTFRSDEIAIKP